jgi:hypothetical protein
MLGDSVVIGPESVLINTDPFDHNYHIKLRKACAEYCSIDSVYCIRLVYVDVESLMNMAVTRRALSGVCDRMKAVSFSTLPRKIGKATVLLNAAPGEISKGYHKMHIAIVVYISPCRH